MRIIGVYWRSNIFVCTFAVGPQTDGVCAGFVASYADGDTVNPYPTNVENRVSS